VLIFTRDHAIDQKLLEELIGRDEIGYLGMIGSRGKIERFRKRLEAKGIIDDSDLGMQRWARLRAPIGLDIGAETPEEIAIAAELIACRQVAGRAPASSTRIDATARARCPRQRQLQASEFPWSAAPVRGLGDGVAGMVTRALALLRRGDTLVQMADGDAAQRTLPGAAVSPNSPAELGAEATLPQAAAPTSGGVAISSPALAQGGARALDSTVDTASGAAHLDTLRPDSETGPVPHGPTLPGPYTVADLPSLPRVDDSTYAIGEEIASGGMGKVLSARDRRLRRDVVIKVMKRDAGIIDPRFEREALITARLQHPSIVRVYDAGVLADGRAFYTMERVRGRSLEAVIAECKTLAERMALLPHAIAVCDAIAYAHSEKVVHRDLKPSNVLIGPFGETVVIDWGLAKEVRDGADAASSSRARPRRPHTPLPIDRAADAGLTQAGAVLGTPSYMAPEQARGEPSDERTDIYALGALLYAMFTGTPPHRGKTTTEMLAQVAAGEHVPIVEREPGLPRELAELVEFAMAYDPKDRIASAKELAEELRRFAAGKLLTSRQYSLAELVRRWLWRHRVTVGVSVAAVALLAGVAVYAFVSVMRARDTAERQREQAERAKLEAQNAVHERNQASDRDKLDMAKQLLASDPSMAAAWLGTLSDEALDWPLAHEIAVKAAHAGLAFELRGHREDVELVAVSPDGTHVATGSDDATARWWNLADHTFVELRGHTGPVEAFAMSPDGNYLATAGTDHDVWLWELGSGMGRRLAGHGDTVRGVAFSPDGTKLASTSQDGTLYVWNVTGATGRQLVHHDHGLRPVIWYDANTLIVGGFDGAIGRFDVTTGRGAMKRAHASALRCFALSPDKNYLLVGDEDGLVTLWTADGARLRTLARHTDVTRKVLFTPDGKAAVSAGGDSRVLVHPIPDGAAISLEGNAAGVKDVAISRDGRHVASAGIDGVVRVWSIKGELVHELRGHLFAVKAVAFINDGRVVSGSEDNNARVWNLEEPPTVPTGLAGWAGPAQNRQKSQRSAALCACNTRYYTVQTAGHEGSRRSPYVPGVLQEARPRGGRVELARPCPRPHAPVHERGHEPVQGRVHRRRDARLQARDVRAEVRARWRQAQRPRGGRQDASPPHVLRDAR
jgi:serine/threonine protein kinase/WD40 repeat protein